MSEQLWLTFTLMFVVDSIITFNFAKVNIVLKFNQSCVVKLTVECRWVYISYSILCYV